jgi:hypothetical protein
MMLRSTPAVFPTHASSRCQADASEGDQEYIRAEAII